MAIYNGDKLVKKLHVGGQRVRAIYAGAEKVWPSIVRVERGEEYGEWTYDDPIRRRTVTPWEQDVYCDDTLGERRTGTPYTQEETAEVAYTYGDWWYYDPSRYRYKTVVYVYADIQRTSETVTEHEEAIVEAEWDGSTYWNGTCGMDYYYIDYKKVRNRYTYADGLIRYSTYYNGDARSRRIDGECGWVRSTVVVSDWANTGSLCNAAGTVGGYDCDGTYRVQYYQQKRTLEECYPDGSGGINRQDEYRAGSVASREQVDGYCGYTSKSIITIDFEDHTFDAGFGDGDLVAQITDSSGKITRSVLLSTSGAFGVELNVGETLLYIIVLINNTGGASQTFEVWWDGSVIDVVKVGSGNSEAVYLQPNIKYSDGSSHHNLEVYQV